MKLRIRGNTLRLRLSQAEVEQLERTGRVEDATGFGPGRRLVYALQASGTATQLSAHYEKDTITVLVPETLAGTWIGTDQVSLEGEQPTGTDDTLAVLVEKDFKCLHREGDAADADAFPHPRANA